MFKLYKYQIKDNAKRLKIMDQRLDLTPYFLVKMFIYWVEWRELGWSVNLTDSTKRWAITHTL